MNPVPSFIDKATPAAEITTPPRPKTPSGHEITKRARLDFDHFDLGRSATPTFLPVETEMSDPESDDIKTWLQAEIVKSEKRVVRRVISAFDERFCAIHQKLERILDNKENPLRVSAIITPAAVIQKPEYAYEGPYKEDIPNGLVKIYYATGMVFEGTWNDGAQVGRCRIVYPNGSNYTGGILDGKYHGFGKFVFTNKDYYEGQYSEGKRHGEGKMAKISEGTVFVGTWKDDKQWNGETNLKYEQGGLTLGIFREGVQYNAPPRGPIIHR